MVTVEEAEELITPMTLPTIGVIARQVNVTRTEMSPPEARFEAVPQFEGAAGCVQAPVGGVPPLGRQSM